ncbi:MAG: uroporphyrinogen decarboxylase family protein [Anaerolineae bacterium]|jgi:uroporphyrinogen decarboxylase
MSLTSRERVLATLNHEKPDRVPIVIGASNATGIKMVTYRRLKKLLNLEAPERYLYDFPELGTALIDEPILERLHVDVRGVLDREPQHILERNANREPDSMYFNSWGGGVTKAGPDNWFPSYHPLAETHSIEDLEKYAWPDMDDPTRVAHVRAEAQKLHQENKYALMGTPWLAFPVERAYEMQRMDKFYYNMGKYPDFVVELLKKTGELCKTLMGHFLDECGDMIDIVKIGDDLGMQSSLMLSPKMYRNYVKPIHADYISFIKSRTKAKVFFHTDGDIFPLIPDFIEMGVDVLNPIQTSAGKMSNLPELKKQFGKNLVFCGAIDTHRVLPFGTPDDVRAEVKRVIELLGEDGGYMLSSVHTVLDDVPAENVLAMVDAVEEFGWYKH